MSSAPSNVPIIPENSPGAHVALLSTALLSTQRASWEQGVAAQAFLELSLSKSRRFSSYSAHLTTHALVHDALVRQSPDDGRWCTVLNHGDPGATDPACIGEALLHVSCTVDARTRAELEASANTMLTFLLTIAPRVLPFDLPEGLPAPISHRVDALQLWSDAPYMMPPFLVAAGLHFGRDTLVREGLGQILSYACVLQHKETGLWSHIYDGVSHTFKRRAAWGVGNGWVCAGIMRCLRLLFDPGAGYSPNIDSETRRLVGLVLAVFEHTLHGCLAHLRQEDGLFHDIVNDTNTFVETNLAQMLAYSIFRYLKLASTCPALGYAKGEMPYGWTAKKLFEMAKKMYDGARAKVDEWGFVQGVCASPRFDRPGTAAEGQAFGVLMEVAAEEWRTADGL
jgi:unsaturated rhamnogalacturonyl hydrolase